MASGLFHSSCSFGSTIGPVIGAVLYAHTGFRWTCEILSFVAYFFGMVYLIGTFVLPDKSLKKPIKVTE